MNKHLYEMLQGRAQGPIKVSVVLCVSFSRSVQVAITKGFLQMIFRSSIIAHKGRWINTHINDKSL